MQENLTKKRLSKTSHTMPELSEERVLNHNSLPSTDSNANHVTMTPPTPADLDGVDDPERMQTHVYPNLPDYYLDSMGLKFMEGDSRYVHTLFSL